MACFGGAGGQHACAIARSLGMATVFVHKYAGILSAYGMALADVVEEAQEPSAETYSVGNESTDTVITLTFIFRDELSEEFCLKTELNFSLLEG